MGGNVSVDSSSPTVHNAESVMWGSGRLGRESTSCLNPPRIDTQVFWDAAVQLIAYRRDGEKEIQASSGDVAHTVKAPHTLYMYRRLETQPRTQPHSGLETQPPGGDVWWWKPGPEDALQCWTCPDLKCSGFTHDTT